MLLQTLPALQLPGGDDAVGILPELVLSGAFVVLMLLDLVVPPSRRSWLALFSVMGLAAAFGVSIFGWFDAAHGRSVYGGSLAYDRFSLFVDDILLVSAALVVLISPGYLNRRGLHYGEYYALILASTVGMMLLASAMSLMVIFLGIELLSIALYILSGFARSEERSQEGALKYLLLGGFASGFLLFGMALVYGETGHTQLALIAAALAKSSAVDPLFLAGVILMFVGLAFKVSAVPFHMWTPDVYQGAPTSVTTFMSVATKVAAFAALVRVFTFTFPAAYSRWEVIVALVAIASMVWGNVAALTQQSVKRMLAYSGIAQAGYILIGVAVTPTPQSSAAISGTAAVLYYLAAYAVTNLGAFAVVTIMAGRGVDLDSYDGLRGLAYRRPRVALAMGLFLLSLGGFPPTAGFFGKFFVFAAAIENQLLPLALWGIATSVVAAVYYLRVGLLMYQRPAVEEEQYDWPRTSLAGATVVFATAAGTLVLGVFVFLIYSVATAAQHAVLPAAAAG
jgi:NADH-quinone oxidoreductase subunit N